MIFCQYEIGCRKITYSSWQKFSCITRANIWNLTKLRRRRRRQRERQKRNRFKEQNNNHAFLYISLLSLHNQDASWPNFKFTWERKRQGDKFYHLCQNSGAVPSLQLRPNSLLLSNWAPWNNREKKWKDAKTVFQRRFHGRRRCRTARSLIESLRRPLLRRSWMRNTGESTST